ncbi:MAG TPA: hypothetical protein DHS57_01530, partial [Erysipelotrichaceae bacterium]|nr:hypothetical protein [Erysipelotrichaceae bacterium]
IFHNQDLPWVAGQFNIDPYDYILFEYKPIKTDTYEKVTIIKVIPNQTTFPIGVEDKTNRYHRMFSDNPEGWGVSPCYDSNGQYANSRIIVTKIHGIKGEI